MPAHIHPGPRCEARPGRPCASGVNCRHAACLKGGRLLLCEEMNGGQFYCFHSEYYLGDDEYHGKPSLLVASAMPGPLPPFVPLPQTPMAKVAARFKGTYDLAGAAVAVSQADTRIYWTNYGTFDPTSLEDLFETTLGMNCYGFVHFAAFLAGRQPVSASGRPLVSGACGTVFTQHSYVHWDGEWLDRGKLVIGIAPVMNNFSGYYHIGISLGGWRMISLGGDHNLYIDSITNVFGILYKDIRMADYNWAAAQNDKSGRTSPFPR